MKKTLITLALASIAVFAIATPASAHNVVTGTSPSDGATIDELPAAYSVTTSEPMLQLGGDAAFALQVTDAAGRFYGDGCLAVDGGTMSMGATAGEPGLYTVVWQIVSEDGHPESGSFTFTWAPGPDVPRTAGSVAPPECGEGVAPTSTPIPGPTAVDTAGPSHAEDSGTADLPLVTVLWIGGGVLVAAIVITIVLLLVRRRGANPAG